MAFVLFGLTGGVASGKSTVAARFRERGLDVIDADQVARDVVAKASEGLAAVVEAFGEEILDAEGTMDRAKMREIVFADDDARKRLNAILHPRIAAETQRRAAALQARGVELACYEAALLVENGLADAFRPLVVVALTPELQRERLAARDGVSLEEAERIIVAQMPLAEKVALADHVIDNSGDRGALLARSDEVLDSIRRDAAGGEEGG
jgi:dephospho-CoA kinase